MKKRFSLVLYVFLALVMVLITGCSSSGETVAGFTTALNQIHLTGIKNIDAEIASIDKEYTAVLVKIQALDQLLAAAMQWVDFHKTQSYKAGVLWTKEVTPEGLDQLKNAQYKVSKLELVAKEGGAGVGWQFSHTITINDIATGNRSDWKSLQDSLNEQKTTWENRRKEKMAVRELATSTWGNLVKNIGQWKIEKYNNVTYIVTGMGLGWQEKLIEGKWAFYTDQKLAQPNGKPAEDLAKVLSARH